MDMTVEVPELPELTFDEASHIYRLNGDIIPSVSKLMEPLKDQCYGGISKRTLENAAIKGSAVHNSIENWIKFGIDDIPSEHRGYFNGFMEWWKQYKPRVFGSEVRIYHTTTCGSAAPTKSRTGKSTSTWPVSITEKGGKTLGDVNCLRCKYRHTDNGNCTAVGGFCTAVPAAHCPLLRQYLDTGMTPEAFQSFVVFLQDLIGNQKASEALDRFRQLVKADKDGRLVVRPCKMGDTLFRVFAGEILEHKVRNMRYLAIQERWDIDTTPFCPYVESSIGKTIFLTHEEAERALMER